MVEDRLGLAGVCLSGSWSGGFISGVNLLKGNKGSGRNYRGAAT